MIIDRQSKMGDDTPTIHILLNTDPTDDMIFLF